MNLESPRGCMLRGEIQLEAHLPLKYRVRAMLYYTIYGMIAGYRFRELLIRSKHKAPFMLFFIPSFFVYNKWTK